MKRTHITTWTAALALCAVTTSQAAITLPPDLPANVLGTDGALTVTNDTVIDLGLAPTGAWNAAGTGAGIFDPDKWAVVFKYSSVKINVGRTLSFKNHPSRAPVVWLVSGDVGVVVDGTVDLEGKGSTPGVRSTEPGPGGFRGGLIPTASLSGGDGLGIGGGTSLHGDGCFAATPANNCGGSGYGNNLMVPLVGGSGGAASDSNSNTNNNGIGAGGGGALLIVATGKVNVAGIVSADGGTAGQGSGAGSGGAVRIVANALGGAGIVSALAGYSLNQPGHGRIRLEIPPGGAATWTGTVQPETIIDAPANPVLLWPSTQDPSVNIVSINQVAVPSASLLQANLSQPDLPPLPAGTQQLTVKLKTTNVSVDAAPLRGKVRVRYAPARGKESLFVDAVLDGGSNASADWTATIPMKHDIAVLQAIAENPK